MIAVSGPWYGNCAGYTPPLYLQVMRFHGRHYDEGMTHADLHCAYVFAVSQAVPVPVTMDIYVIATRIVPPEPDTILMMMGPVSDAEQLVYITLIFLADVVTAGIGEHHIIPHDLHLPLQNRPSEWGVMSGFDCHCLAAVVVVVAVAAAVLAAMTCALRARLSCWITQFVPRCAWLFCVEYCA